ncbi:RGS domain-containing protein [Rhodotorula diobovata]|uniref:RGS domain-containing protein n=1 Tax=Rhodotorula diobovata TaxID=5288 RepID=A0A5C5FQC1_9BASI|nr:RGS domain-containing protein [Rhodotorula diobovata]
MASRARTQQPARNRLPSLAEVLRRSTRPPVDLYCFYLFLQREGSEDALDFWLDVQQHENLCRAYFKDLRKSGIHVRDDWPQYHRLARTRGSIYGNVTGIRRGDTPALSASAGTGTATGTAESDYDGEQYARPGSAAPTESHSALSSPGFGAGFAGHSAEGDEKRAGFDGDDEDEKRQHLAAPEERDAARYQLRSPSPSTTTATSRAGTGGAYPLSPTLRALYPHEHDDDGADARQGAPSRRSHKRHSTAQAQPIIARTAAISRTDLIASAERIFSRYLMPGADKEVYLPPSLRITSFPLSSSQLPSVTHPDYEREADAQARVPDMFHAQKDFVYRAMEGDSFPRFLRAKAFGNLTPLSGVVRLVVGLFALWAGLATAFAFIFLDAKPKVRRLWVILPFTVAVVNIVAHAYDLDPLMVFMGLTETTPFRTIGIREPYVRKLLFGRALWVTLLSSAVVAVLTVLFWAVPGHRL